MSEITRQRQHDPLVVAFAREAVSFRSIQLRIRFADGKLVVTAIGGWSILGFDKGQPTSVVVRSKDEFQARVAITRGSPSSETQPAKSTARFSIRDHGSNAAYSHNKAH
jgi:hypothetical protein